MPKHVLRIKPPIEIEMEGPAPPPTQEQPHIKHLRDIIGEGRPPLALPNENPNKFESRQAVVDEAISSGWNKGAIVVPLYTGGRSGAKYISVNWGTIIGHKRYFDEKNETFFHPLRVKWWKDNSETFEHPKELILVNPAPDEGKLQERIVQLYNLSIGTQ